MSRPAWRAAAAWLAWSIDVGGSNARITVMEANAAHATTPLIASARCVAVN